MVGSIIAFIWLVILLYLLYRDFIAGFIFGICVLLCAYILQFIFGVDFAKGDIADSIAEISIMIGSILIASLVTYIYLVFFKTNSSKKGK